MLMGDERLRPILDAWLAPLADLGAAHTSLGAPGGTDHVKFHQWGMTGVPFLQDLYPFVSRAHHSNQDLFDSLRQDGLRKSAAVVAAVAYQAAMSSERLPRPNPVYP